MSNLEIQKYDVIIIGAGISGLNCANKLTKGGLTVLVIEKSDSIGGRIKTDFIDGFQLNRGFHVLLTAYPEVKSTFIWEDLSFKKFFSGCLIWTGSSMVELADPLKHPIRAIRHLVRPIGNFKDYLLLVYLWFIFKVRLQTRKDISTNDYFKKLGFSDLFITRFLRPFFSGVFLEHRLETSVEKFNETFKSFLNGDVVLPKQGIVSLANQLFENSPDYTLMLNSEVNKISEDEVQLRSGELFKANYVVVASGLKSRNRLLALDEQIMCNRVVNLYFSYNKNNKFPEYKLVLNGSNSGPINNLVFMEGALSNNEKGLISISVIDPQYFELENIEEVVLNQLIQWYGDISGINFLIKYDIQDAVPYQSKIEQYNLRLVNNIYCCGDYCGVASLNTSLKTSRMVAEAILSEN